MIWLILFLAGLLETVWAVGLKYTEGFSRLWPSVMTLAAMAASVWLLSVAVKNRAIDLLRSRKWRGGEPGEDGLDTCIRTLVADHIEEEFQLSQLSDEIDFCISGLSEQCRRVFLLSRMTGLKIREIAERLNISVKTVEKHIGSALAKLRLRLGRSGFLRLFL